MKISPLSVERAVRAWVVAVGVPPRRASTGHTWSCEKTGRASVLASRFSGRPAPEAARGDARPPTPTLSQFFTALPPRLGSSTEFSARPRVAAVFAPLHSLAATPVIAAGPEHRPGPFSGRPEAILLQPERPTWRMCRSPLGIGHLAAAPGPGPYQADFLLPGSRPASD